MAEIAMVVAAVASLIVAMALAAIVWMLWCFLRRRAPSIARYPFERGPPSTDDLPDGLADWIREESEEWARMELRSRALALYQETGNWAEVGLMLRKTLAEGSE